MTDTNDQVVKDDQVVTEDVKKTPETVPYSVFSDKVAKKNQVIADLQAKIDSNKAAQEAIRTAELEKQGEYKTLLDEAKETIKQLTVKTAKYDEYQETRRTALTEKLPEDRRKFAASMNLADLEEFVELEAKQTTVATKGDSPSPNGDYGGYKSNAEWASNDPEGYKKARAEGRRSNLKIGYGG